MSMVPPARSIRVGADEVSTHELYEVAGRGGVGGPAHAEVATFAPAPGAREKWAIAYITGGAVSTFLKTLSTERRRNGLGGCASKGETWADVVRVGSQRPSWSPLVWLRPRCGPI